LPATDPGLARIAAIKMVSETFIPLTPSDPARRTAASQANERGIRSLLLLAILLGALAFGFSGCSSRPFMTQQEEQANRERQSIERPARGIDEETSIIERAGQVAVVLLIVGVLVAGILVPILLI
jgi:hypothetical protein